MTSKGRSVLTILLQDHPGALNRVVSLIRRRGYNIASLYVAASETPGISRMKLVVDANDITKVVRQLDRLIDVLHVEVVSPNGETTDGEIVLRP